MPATGGQAAQHTSQYQRIREPLMLPSDFQTDLNVNRAGARAVFLSGDIRTLVRVPFIDTSKQRAMVKPAAWLARGYDRPTWGAKPPKVDLPEIEDDASPKPPVTATPPQPRPQATPLVPNAQPQKPQQGAAGDEGPVPDLVEVALDAAAGAVAPAGVGIVLEIMKTAGHVADAVDLVSPADAPASLIAPAPEADNTNKDPDEVNRNENESE